MIPARLTRMSWRLYLGLLLVLILLSGIVFEFLVVHHGDSYGNIDMSEHLRGWLLPPVVLVAVLFFGHAAFAATASASSRTSTPVTKTSDAPAAVGNNSSDSRFALEIRGLGVVVDKYRQRALWERLDEEGAKGTLLPQDPKAYPWSSDDRSFARQQREGNALEYALPSGWVERWPIPTIVLGPARNDRDPDADHIEGHIASARQSAGLGITLFVQLRADQANDSDDVIAKLFNAFEQNPQLPAVVVLAQDGALTRRFMRAPGSEISKDGNFVPKQPDSFVALLVSRKDRVDRDIRPYVVDVPYSINLNDTKYDVIRLWNYYWKFQKEYVGVRSATMPWDYWQKLVPGLESQVTNRGPGDFKPNPWVPIRWTDWQLKQYDDAPLLGYLHRPVEVSFTDEQGAPLKRLARVAKLKEGWTQAIGTLPEGQAPSRVFFDPGSSSDSWIALTQALHGNEQHLDLDDPEEGFNTAQRVGDTGTASPWVQIGLAVMRGYAKGGTTATVNLRNPNHASIVMVSPPDDAYRQKHPQLFDYGVK
ncbi:type VI lipase adapter Tla3 domain-containing protein [Paraburkholderia fungorum]|jgi:Protein of unknown function (DUF2875)|uniref:type VI lipase adapter Tla3 domain-containing protein n=1 Tax=Paraburkholderia fungorum TaxID=134537 RepID=UPI00241BEEE8|nr:DUF2875 family protein [Paraburkholderia fungorum]